MGRKPRVDRSPEEKWQIVPLVAERSAATAISYAPATSHSARRRRS
jgi:hypothetical protein